MQINTGIDIVCIQRIEQIYKKYKNKFIIKILNPDEQKKISIYRNTQQIIYFIARRFAAKEAITKALQTGITEKYNFQNISILNHSKSNKPIVYIDNKIQNNISISISSNTSQAVASCIYYSH